MKALLWKEWREHRIIFFVSLAVIIITRMSLVLRTKDALLNITAHGSLSLLFTVFLGASSFTNEFSKETIGFLLCQPLTKARVYWTKFLFGLFLLSILVIFTTLAFVALDFKYERETNFEVYAKCFPFVILITYCATFLTSLLVKNPLVTVIATPFVAGVGVLLLLVPFLLVIAAIVEAESLFEGYPGLILGVILCLILVLVGFLLWKKTISVSRSPLRVMAKGVLIAALVVSIVAIGLFLIFMPGIRTTVLETVSVEEEIMVVFMRFLLLILLGFLLLVLLGFLYWKKVLSISGHAVKVVVLTAIGGVLLLLAAFNVANFVAGRQLRDATMSAREIGLPLSLREIVRPQVPESENAAPVYEEIFSIYEKVRGRYAWLDLRNGVKNLSAEQKRTLPQLVSYDPDLIRMYELVKRASDMPYCRFDLRYEDGLVTALPHLAKMRAIARMVAARTVLLAEQNKYMEALDCARIGLRIGDMLERDPFEISQLVRIACDSIAIDSISETISNIPPGAVPVETYFRLIAEIETRNGFSGVRRALEGRTALLSDDIFGGIPTGKVRRDGKLWYFAGNSRFWTMFGRFYLGNLGMPMARKDVAFGINWMTRLAQICVGPYYEVKDEMKQLGQQLQRDIWRHPLSSLFLEGMTRFPESQARNTAELGGVKIALVLKIYKIEKGEYPVSLNALVPEYLPELPKDPFTGKDYSYRTVAEGFIVSAVGDNETDGAGFTVEK
jgi:ABC-type transport system involved in multi-copper enzyme maturation permease subunit